MSSFAEFKVDPLAGLNLDENLGLVVDLDRYPIQDLEHPKCLQLIADCHKQLSEIGSVSFPGFIRSDVIEKMAYEVQDLPSYNRLGVLSPYGVAADILKEKLLLSRQNQGESNPQIEQNHPLNHMCIINVHAVAADCIPVSSLLRQVYDSPKVMSFLAKVQQCETLYQYGDEFQKINVMYMKDGGSRCWHYDGSDCVVTLMLQPSVSGGEFEFAPFIRGDVDVDGMGVSQVDSPEFENYPQVQKLLHGEYQDKRISRAAAGTLNLFHGLRSMHRVRTVYGPVTRVVAVLSYDTIPNRCGSIPKNISLYGERVREIYEQREGSL